MCHSANENCLVVRDKLVNETKLNAFVLVEAHSGLYSANVWHRSIT